MVEASSLKNESRDATRASHSKSQGRWPWNIPRIGAGGAPCRPAALPRCAGCVSTSTDGDARLGRAARKIDSTVSGPFSRLELASRAHANWWVGASLGPGATGPAKVVAGHAGPTGTVLACAVVVVRPIWSSGRLENPAALPRVASGCTHGF